MWPINVTKFCIYTSDIFVFKIFSLPSDNYTYFQANVKERICRYCTKQRVVIWWICRIALNSHCTQMIRIWKCKNSKNPLVISSDDFTVAGADLKNHKPPVEPVVWLAPKRGCYRLSPWKGRWRFSSALQSLAAAHERLFCFAYFVLLPVNGSMYSFIVTWSTA